MKQVICIIAAYYMSILSSSASVLQHCRQCLVVTTDSWTSSQGTMSIFERESVLSPWQQRGAVIPVVVGKTGLGWGRGLTMFYRSSDPIKKEGDHKAPAGIFVLRGAFGYAPKAETEMNYLPLTKNIVGVDDSQSRYYNQLIDTSRIDHRDWRSAEEMFRKDNLYKWGVIVDHNVPPQPGAGSCIFLHIWRGPNQPTIGCTAMSEKHIVDLIRWLNPTRAPLLVQLPRPVFDELRDKWNLPPLR